MTLAPVSLAAPAAGTEPDAAAELGRDYLEARLREFPLAAHLGVAVERADDGEVVLRAPLAANINDKGTAFAGSLYSLAVLAGWAWLTRYLAARGLPCEVMIHESSASFVAPCTGEIRARAAAPPQGHIDKLRRMLERAGRGRLALAIEIGRAGAACVSFEGVYAVVNSKPEGKS